MDNTQRMIALLGRVRKEMNGAVSESMAQHGQNYGLNYGVSIATLREIAANETKDYAFAKYLYQQQVRELKLLACHIADPKMIDTHEFPFWSRGIANAELAEELAFALLSKIYDINSLMGVWSTESNEMVAYASLMAASRNERTTSEVAFIAVENAVKANPESHYIAAAVVALLLYVASRDKSVKVGIPILLDRLADTKVKQYIVEELEWRLEYL
ncbi:MAG: DNA alkylation repair protein [Alistipes sp.]|nr:DNA alkylation repair protein [Alistipes sp.]MBR5584962.1 DNA alkylation repair protein [Alistipes sp.]MBR6544889.1 DNA alkylation repair protein [Alistipes sp.]